MTGDGIVGWAWLVIGLLAVAMVREGSVTVPTPEVGAVDRLRARPIELKTATVRELRRLPGIGNRRAVQISRARWAHDPVKGVLELDDLPGIGPMTRARVESALLGRETPRGNFGSALELAGPPAPEDSAPLLQRELARR